MYPRRGIAASAVFKAIPRLSDTSRQAGRTPLAGVFPRAGIIMIEIFKAAVQRGASDIHIKVGDFLRARIHGELVPLTQQRLSQEQVRQICLQLISNSKDRDRFDEIRDYDCSWGAPGLGRFRVNILRQRGTPMAVMRVIPIDIPNFETLRLPPVLSAIAQAERGLVLVTGVTGSGKSSTLAAIVGYINNTRRKHIITLENPIEFLHRDINCSITQREVGSDTPTFDQGLKSALREDPDVVMIGEMRDTTTIDTAMKAGETGHLVLSTLHTTNAVQTITRIIAVFPPHEQEMVRIRMAETLVAVISQRLLPRKDSRGRVVAAEVMVVTGTIQDAIMQGGDKQHEIYDLIADGKEQYGSQTFDQHLRDLVDADLVSYEVAKAAANNPADFELKMRTLV
jgi:twitching motility protein PilT